MKEIAAFLQKIATILGKPPLFFKKVGVLKETKRRFKTTKRRFIFANRRFFGPKRHKRAFFRRFILAILADRSKKRRKNRLISGLKSAKC